MKKEINTNIALNALLNYYTQSADSKKIPMDLEIGLPEYTSVTDVDLCSIIGNMLDNSILACESVPEPDRFIDLTIRQDQDSLLILTSNSFCGEIRQQNGQFLSTRRHGNGIGIRSITSTAEKYGGMARFSYEDHEFYAEVALPIHT